MCYVFTGIDRPDDRTRPVRLYLSILHSKPNNKQLGPQYDKHVGTR